jgi:hypothetical protein
MLAPIIRETPAAIEKNATREEKSRMRGRGAEAHYSTSRVCQVSQAHITAAAGPRWNIRIASEFRQSENTF